MINVGFDGVSERCPGWVVDKLAADDAARVIHRYFFGTNPVRAFSSQALAVSK